jgi:hypothetical protein
MVIAKKGNGEDVFDDPSTQVKFGYHVTKDVLSSLPKQDTRGGRHTEMENIPEEKP